MISVSEAKKDTAFVHNGQKWLVLDSSFTHPSRGASVYSIKARNLLTQNVNEFTFKSGEMLEEVSVERKKAQFLYATGTQYFFMDGDTFEQFELADEDIGDKKKFMLDGADYFILYVDDKPISLILPPKVDLKVTESQPGARGDTATNPQKDVTVETGYSLKVPLFINEGNVIRINTETGLYVERAK